MNPVYLPGNAKNIFPEFRTFIKQVYSITAQFTARLDADIIINKLYVIFPT